MVADIFLNTLFNSPVNVNSPGMGGIVWRLSYISYSFHFGYLVGREYASNHDFHFSDWRLMVNRFIFCIALLYWPLPIGAFREPCKQIMIINIQINITT